MQSLAALAIAVAACVVILGKPMPLSAGPVLDRVKGENLLRCGVTRSGVGLSETDEVGEWRGFFPEFCRAIAAAVTGNADAVDYIEVDDVVRFEALRDDAFDVLVANTTWTASRDTIYGLSFTGTLYYDGQSFLAHRSLGARAFAEVTEAVVCVPAGTTTIQNLRELAARKPGLRILDFDALDSVYDAFFERACDMLTYDRVTLLSQLYSRAGSPDDYVLFPDIVSKEPLGPVVKRGDKAWFDAVRWISFATISAEELGITAANADAMRDSDNPEVQRLLGVAGSIGENLHLPADWAYQAIKQVGNYGEIFARTLGADSPLGLERGFNALWQRGGLMYAPPIR